MKVEAPDDVRVERLLDAQDKAAQLFDDSAQPGANRAEAAERLVSALRERFDLPVHVHTHDTPGGQLDHLRAVVEPAVQVPPFPAAQVRLA